MSESISSVTSQRGCAPSTVSSLSSSKPENAQMSFRIALTHPVQKRHERALILRLERVAAEQRQTSDEGLFQLVEDDLLGRRVKRLAVVKVPCLRLEAVVAVVRAAGDEQRHAHADAVGNVTGLDLTVIHSNSSQTAGAPLQTRPPGIFLCAPPYRCSTRSLISCVRPWFQNCVPM